ncbi:MAG: protein kinase [Proteobacteria bacterium]|nr:protein kinase [Pseudomonadota bacterium]
MLTLPPRYHPSLEQIGQGGFGVVYKTVDQVLGIDVAVKVPYRNRGDEVDDELHREVATELQAVAILRHPAIIQMLDGGVSTEGNSFLVMEYAGAGSMQQWIQGAPPRLGRVGAGAGRPPCGPRARVRRQPRAPRHQGREHPPVRGARGRAAAQDRRLRPRQGHGAARLPVHPHGRRHAAVHAAHADIRGISIHDDSYGIYMTSPAFGSSNLDVRDVIIDGVVHGGLFVEGASANVSIRDSVIRNVDDDGEHTAAGISLLEGNVSLENVRIEDVQIFGILANGPGSNLTITDLDIIGTGDGVNHNAALTDGLIAQGGASVTMEGVRLLRNGGIGLFVNDGSSVEATDLTIEDTQNHAIEGNAIVIQGASTVSIDGLVSSRNQQFAIFAVDEGTTVELNDALIEDQVLYGNPLSGYALQIEDGALLTGSNITLLRNPHRGPAPRRRARGCHRPRRARQPPRRPRLRPRRPGRPGHEPGPDQRGDPRRRRDPGGRRRRRPRRAGLRHPHRLERAHRARQQRRPPDPEQLRRDGHRPGRARHPA